MNEAMNSNPSTAPGPMDRPPSPELRSENICDNQPQTIPDHTGADAAGTWRAEGSRWQAEARREATRAAALATEVRTLRERLIVARARAAALEQRSQAQGEDLEKYHHALAGAAEALRQQQNLAASYPLHVGAVLIERGRWLLAEYRQRGLRGRLKLLPRVGEFLDFQGRLAEAVVRHPEWATVKADLEAVRAVRWYRQLCDGRAVRRSLANLARRFRKAA